MSRQKILIIQENLRERMGLTQLCESLGFHVDTAIDGNKAKTFVFKKKYGMIIADFETPDFSPIKFLQTAKTKNIETEILFISNQPLIEDAVEIMKYGAFDFIVKPFDKEHLELCIKKIFTKKKKSKQKEDILYSKNKNFDIITGDKGMLKLLKLVKKVADSSASIFIQGESGTGKELFARFVHEKSNRKNMPFVAVNCAALPESLLESELFGHEKGAFTGAISRKFGKFELANKGTLFLDEITEMQFHLQAKLLRVLQEKKVDRVGGLEPVDVDVRIVATTNKDVKEAIKKREFRNDLYYRLNTIPLKIPTLEERIGDIKLLSEFFIKKYNDIDKRDIKGLTKSALSLLNSQSFAGNVRELENIIHRAVLLADKENIEPCNLLMEDLDTLEKDQQFPYNIKPIPLKDMEEKMIFHTLNVTQGNRTHAAKILGISVRTMRNKLAEYKQKI